MAARRRARSVLGDVKTPARVAIFIAAWIAFALGIVGLFLPLVPTTPFILLAAFLFAKSSRRFHHWISHHQVFGKSVRDWEERRAISRKGKLAATVALLLSFVPHLFIELPRWVVPVQAPIIFAVLIFIWTRRE